MHIQQRKRAKWPWAVLGAFVVIVAAGAYFLYAQQSDLPQEPVVENTPQPVVIEEEKPTYSIFSEKPANIRIDTLGIDASIIEVGLTASGAMDTPRTLEDVGWYDKSAQLGSYDRYSILMDGHYGTDASPGIFYSLHKITEGDTIIITGTGGSEATFEVVEIERRRLEDVDMKKAYSLYPSSLQSLTLITCEGDFDSARQTYDDRIVVYASRIN